MSRATVTTFGRGVSFVASGETGTQANEFEAAIKSVTSSTTVGAVFIYDTRNDSDGGAWRKKCAGLSWYDEDLNTATRGGRREFPSVALIVADNPDSGNKTVTIYDLDDPAMPMWMVFNCDTTAYASNATFISCAATGANSNDITSVYALNGRLFVGGAANGFVEIDFTTEQQTNYRPDVSATAVLRHKKSGRIADRNDTSGQVSIAGTPIVSNAVNDVAATIVEGAEIGALGLPIPTVAVATDGGVSVIHPNGTVADDTYQIAGNNKASGIGFNSTGGYFYASNKPSTTYDFFINRHNLIYSDTSSAVGSEMYRAGATASGTPALSLLGGVQSRQQAWAVTKNTYAIGSTSGLSLIKYNTANPSEGAVCDVTSSYNTGYMLGDIRGAFLMNTKGGDKSVKGNTLTENGSITGTKFNDDLYGYSGWSASNYLSRASDTDFDFGTGDFSIMFWVKTTNTATSENYVTRADSTPETGDFTVLKTGSNKLNFFIRDGASWTLCAVSTSDIGSDWQQVVVARSGTLVSLYINGVREDSNTHSLTMTPSGGSEFRIGNRADSSTTPAADASLSLVRLSATAPTPQQVKDIYEAEKPLFRAGAKCLLESNTVRTMAYDKSTDVLYVSDAGGYLNHFRGLEVVQQDDDSTDTVVRENRPFGSASAAGGIVAQYAVNSPSSIATAALGVSLPAIDVRGDINTADTKLPDDGKFHFSGVTTDATQTTIGVIPIAEDETMEVLARVTGIEYQNQSSDYFFGEIKRTFYRKTGASSQNHGESSKLTNESLDSMDLTLVNNATAETCDIKVTGKAATRMVWKAEVKVTRISEKTYER